MAMTEVEAYVRQQAAIRGMDPDKVVRAINTEGGVKDPFRRAEYVKNGYREPSYGPMQMLVGGDGTGFPEGLGNKMIRETGKDPRTDWKAGVDYGLDTVSREGWRQWYGPKNAGLDRYYGVKAGTPDPNAQMAAYTPVQAQAPNTNTAAVNPATIQGIASLPTVADAAITPNPTATTPASPAGGIFSALLQGATQQPAPQVPDEPMVRMADGKPSETKVAETSQTPNVYIDDLKRKYL